MTDRMKAFWLGLFIIVAIVLATWLILFLRPTVGDGRKTLRVRFSNVEKITVGSRVTFAGKPIGEVYKINEIYNARSLPADKSGNLYFYELVLKIDSKIKVFNTDEIVFSTSGLLGEKTIEIIPKNAPPGEPPGHELKNNEIIYARSSDKMQEALNDLVKVSETINKTMNYVNNFLDKHGDKLAGTLEHLNAATTEISHFFAHANETDFVVKAASAFESMSHTCSSIGSLTDQFTSPNGTFGRLLNSDSMYLKLSATLSRFEMALGDINRYGVFFQFDKAWQKEKKIRECRLQDTLGCYSDFSEYFTTELTSISDSLYKISCAIDKMKRGNVQVDESCFNQKFEQLLYQVQEVEQNLKYYNQTFMQQCN